MKKWFYERSRFSEFKSNTTYHKLLQMTADEFTEWARLLRSEVTEQWDVHGTPPVIGKDEEAQDDWGFPSQNTAQPPVAAPPMAPGPSQPAAPPLTQPPAAAPQVPTNEPTSMTITVPPGVVSGQVLTVGLPDGRTVNVQVPVGCNAGSQFTITVN